MEVPEEAVAVAVRLHPYAKMTGTIFFDDLSLKVIGTATALGGDGNTTALRFELLDNYPNPFNPTTTIGYTLPEAGQVSLDIYNLLGQHVRSLVNEDQAAGTHRIVWDGKDSSGKSLGSGVYFYQLRTNRAVTVKRMVLVK